MNFRPSRSRDVQAIAARRLAALAESFDRSGVDRDQPLDAPDPAPPRQVVSRPPGRHAAPPTGRSRIPRFSSHHLTIIAIVVAAGCVLAGWQVLRSVPDAGSVALTGTRIETAVASEPTQTPAEVPTAPTSTAPDSAVAVSEGLLVVDVTGKVRRPGIVELPAGSRVVDALEAAGGARPAADTSMLNLARVLVDGEQIVVGLAVPDPEPGVPAAGSAQAGPTLTPININSATAEQLEALPGVGPVTAAAILEWRTQHGAFSTVDELLEVSGIGEATLRELTPYVHV